ncbi:MAG: MMPL family transporter, partial [Kiloniellales bacterium]
MSLVTLLLFIGLRSPRLVIATLATLLMGLVWTAAFAAAAVGHLNLISLGFAVLFVGLGVDFGIHFGLRYKEAIQRGIAHAAALRDAANGVGDALTLCALAAAIGFFSFVGTEFIGLSELGIISGSSMFIALFANLTLMPAVLTLLPLKPERRAAAAAVSGVRPTTPELLVRRHARMVVLGALLLGAAAALLLPRVRFDFDPLHLKDPNSESASTFVELQRDDRASTHSLSVLTGSLEEAVALAQRLEGLETVDDTRTLADYVPKEQDQKLEMIDGMALFLTPVLDVSTRQPPPAAAERRAALSTFRGALKRLLAAAPNSPVVGGARRLAAALDRFEAGGAGTDAGLEELEGRLLATLPARLDRLRQSLNAERVKIGDLPERLRGREIATDGRYRVQVYPAEDVTENAALRRFVTTVTEVAPAATGGPVVILGAGDAVSRAMRQAVLTAFAAISLLLLLVLRSLVEALLVLLPLVLASLLTLATAVLLNLPFNFANIIVLPLLLSLGVASGIHLV